MTSDLADLKPPFTAEAVLMGDIVPEDETLRLNDWIVQCQLEAPNIWNFSEQDIRAARRRGESIFPLEATSERAQTIEIGGPRGPLPLRLVWPEGNDHPKRAYLHIHGGGWVFGAHDMQDEMLQDIADACQALCVSVGYGLAPEEPYPAAQDDCEAAALWLIRDAAGRYGLESFAIGGESAGAHLSLCTLLRLRDRHDLLPFTAANLVCGCFDLAMTPSMSGWEEDRLVLNGSDIAEFRKRYLYSSDSNGALSLRNPDISPLYGDLSGLPPVLVTAGTRDPLLDDSLFLHQRLLSEGTFSHLAVYPGGCHVFIQFDIPLASAARRHCHDFLNRAMG